MEKEQYFGPQVDLSRVPDYRLRDSIEYPWSSYEETMSRWGNGWDGGYTTSIEVDYMVSFAADAFRYFSGYHGGQFALEADVVTYEDVLKYVGNDENQARFGIHAFEEEIARAAYKYIKGEGDDYETFARL